MNKKISFFFGLLIIITLSFLVAGIVLFYYYYYFLKDKNNFVFSNEIPEKIIDKSIKEPVSIKDKAEKEISFAKEQFSKAEKIFEEIKDIDNKIRSKYGYYDMYEERIIMPKDFVILNKDGNVEVTSDKIILTESLDPQTRNSAFLHLLILAKEGDNEMKINYRFLNKGDGDQAAVWVNGEMAFVMTGRLIEKWDYDRSTNFSFGGKGSQTVSFALHAYGDINSKVEFSNITITSFRENILSEYKSAYSKLESLNNFKIEQNIDNDTLKIVDKEPLPEAINEFGFFGAESALKKAEALYNDSKYDEAYANAYYARIITEKIVSGWKIF